MPTSTQHIELLDLKASQIYAEASIAVGLADGAFTTSTPSADILATELPMGNGYQRITSTLSNVSRTGNELVLPTITATFTASGAAWQWQTAFVLLTKAGVTTLAALYVEDAPVQLLDGRSHTYKLTLSERLG